MKKNIFKLLLIFGLVILYNTNVYAATFSVTANSRSITKGSSTTLTITGNDVTGRFNISTSNSSVVSISEDRAWIENDTYRINLTAHNVGQAIITVTPIGVSDSNGNTLNLGSKTISITVSLPREKSSDNYLKSLSIEGYDISPEFDKGVQIYNATVPEGTESITINASANESHAQVSGTGNKIVSNGTNTFNIVVKSETGTEKIYTLNVEVKDSNPITTQIDASNLTVVKLKEYLEKPAYFEESTIEIDGIEIPAFVNKQTNTTLVGLKDNNGHIELYAYSNGKYTLFNQIISNYHLLPVNAEELNLITTTVTINKESYKAYKYSENSPLYIISAINLENGKTNFYLYDPDNQSAILYDDTYIVESENHIAEYTNIIIALGSVLVVLLIIIFILIHNLRKKQQKIDKFIKKQEAKLEATRKLNDVVSAVKNITEMDKEIKKDQSIEMKSKKTKKTDLKDNIEKETKEDKETEETYNLFEEDKKSKKRKK